MEKDNKYSSGRKWMTDNSGGSRKNIEQFYIAFSVIVQI